MPESLRRAERLPTRRSVVAGLVTLPWGQQALADTPPSAGDRGASSRAAAPALTPAQREAKARAYFTDTALLAHDGRTLRFYSDVLKDRVVLINFVFTGCGDACPLITQKLLHTRQLLGAQARDVRFVSISVDPDNDTPKTLAAFAERQSAVWPEWIWLTGAKNSVEAVTSRLGAFTEDPRSHVTGMIIGNLRTDRWTRVRPDAPPPVIVAELRRVGELTGAAGAPANLR